MPTTGDMNRVVWEGGDSLPALRRVVVRQRLQDGGFVSSGFLGLFRRVLW